MNADKAKEFFSAYFEGTLDRGLRESFERRLATDPKIKAEYAAFERTMQMLQELAAPVPDPDFDLGERISARLDRYVHESKQRTSANWFGRWRTLLVAGVCVLAVAGAVVELGPGGAFKRFVSGGVVTGNQIADRFTVSVRDGEPTITFVTGSQKTIVVRDPDTGRVLAARTADGSHNPLRVPLKYVSTDPKLIEVQIADAPARTYVALPGSNRTLPTSGHGTLRDLSLALADRYHLVVVLAPGVSHPVAWDLKDDAVASATDALQGTSRTVEQQKNGVLWIQ